MFSSPTLFFCSHPTRWGMCVSILLLCGTFQLCLCLFLHSAPLFLLSPPPTTERNKHVSAHIWPVLSGHSKCSFLFRKQWRGSNDHNGCLLYQTPQTYVKPDDHVLQHDYLYKFTCSVSQMCLFCYYFVIDLVKNISYIYKSKIHVVKMSVYF